ncbi:MAG: DUF5686 family protein [Bacteroidia bacterium]|nr:DUF5686 family protein [Bacteroidia bacterium]
MKRILFFAFLVCSFCCSYAFQLKGKVTDAEGKPIPYLSVFLKNSTYGTLTNLKGDYFLELDGGSYTLVFQHISYKKKSIEVEVLDNEVLNVSMEFIDIQIEEVEISAGKKDPAYAIMKSVIESKKEYVYQFDTYTCETYIKATLERDTLGTKRNRRRQRQALADSIKAAKDSSLVVKTDTLIQDTVKKIRTKEEQREQLELIESVSQTYFKSPGTYKSVVKAYRDLAGKMAAQGTAIRITDQGTLSGGGSFEDVTNPYLFYTDVSDADINFYRNLVNIKDLGDRPFISPLHSTLWRVTYKYRLVDKFYENSKVIYKINVQPRSKDGPYFKGDIYVIDGLWAIKSVNLEIIPSTLSFHNKFHLIHEYEKTSRSRWVIKREEYLYQVKDNQGEYYGHSIAMHKDYKLDIEIPNRFFKNELRKVEAKALEQDDSFWANSRPISLKQKELDYIHVRDSILAYHQSEEYLQMQDSISNHLDWRDFLFNGIRFSNRLKGLTFTMAPIAGQMRPFGVGGYRHSLDGGVRKEFEKGYQLRFNGGIDYGFRNRDVKGYGIVNFTYLPKKFARAYVKYGDQYRLVTLYENIATILSRSNYINQEYVGLGNSMEIFNGFFIDASATWSERRAIDGLELAEWSQDLFGADNVPREFDDYKEFLLDIKLRYTPGQKYKTLPYRKVILGSHYPTFFLRYKKSIPGIFGSEINYDFLEVGARHSFDLRTMGHSQWVVYAGRFLQAQNIRFTDLKFIRGSDPYFFVSPLDFFQLLGPTFSTQNAYVQGNYYHNFNGVLIDKIPLLKRTKLQTSVGGGILGIEDGNFFHTEVFAGVQHPFRILKTRFRIGAYYVTAYSNYENAISGQVKFGISFYNPVNHRWDY